jgi:hypothetical protein
MLTWNEIVSRWIVKHNNLIKKITSPLKQSFGVEYFTYHRIDKDGKYSVLIDRPEWAEFYVSKKIYLADPYLRMPQVYESGLCLLGDHGSEEYRKKVIVDGEAILQCDSAVMLVQKNEAGVEFYGFSGNCQRSQLKKLFAP